MPILFLIMASLIYICLSPVVNLTYWSLIIVCILFIFAFIVIGFPFALMLKLNQEERPAYYFLKTCIVSFLSLVLPWLLLRAFQLNIAGKHSVSQVGEYAIFDSGEISTNGQVLLTADLASLIFAAFLFCVLLYIRKFFKNNWGQS